jgi:effector-binding domain-containing protein
MRILKKVALVIGALIIVYVVVAAFCSPKVHVQRSAMISADSKTTFDQVNILKNWQSWSYWDNIDPNMKSEYEGPESGIGAVHKWSSDNDSVGHGSLTITKSEPGKLVEYELLFEGMGSSLGGWQFSDTAGGVMVTTYMDMEPPFFMRPIMAMMNMDEMLGADFEKTLAGLKKRSEELAAAPKTPEMKIELTTMGPMKFLAIRDSATDKELEKKFGPMYAEIQAVMEKQKLTFAGSPIGIYYDYKDLADGSMWFVFDAAIPVDKAAKDDGRVHYTETAGGGNVVKASYYGSYDGMKPAHDAINEWIKKNNKKVNGPVWEIYVTDPGTEPDPSKVLTEIYYPVE